MLPTPGFSQHSLTTSLGKMAYYTADGPPWRIEGVSEDTPRENLVKVGQPTPSRPYEARGL